MITVALALLILASAAQAGQAEQPKDILCDICVDVVTDIDEWITSDSTMDEIIEFVENVSSDALVHNILTVMYSSALCSPSTPLWRRSAPSSSRSTSPRSSTAW